jgi:hypothetical protein
VELDVFHLRAVRAQVFVERDETWLVRVNELDPAWRALLLAFEFGFPDLVGRDEMNGPGMRSDLHVDGVLPGFAISAFHRSLE